MFGIIQFTMADLLYDALLNGNVLSLFLLKSNFLKQVVNNISFPGVSLDNQTVVQSILDSHTIPNDVPTASTLVPANSG